MPVNKNAQPSGASEETRRTDALVFSRTLKIYGLAPSYIHMAWPVAYIYLAKLKPSFAPARFTIVYDAMPRSWTSNNPSSSAVAAVCLLHIAGSVHC